MKLLNALFLLILAASVLPLTDANPDQNESHPQAPTANPNKSAYSEEPTPSPTKSSQKQKSHSTETNKQAAPHPQGTDKNPIVVKSPEAKKSAEPTEQERTEREEKPAHEGSLILWTVVMALATVCLVLIAGAQLIMFWRQLRYIRDSLTVAQDATDAAVRGASATRDSADTAKLSMIASARAYVSIIFAEITNIQEGGIPVARLVVKNSGQTPAYDLTGMGGMAMGESFNTLPAPTGRPEKTRSSLAPGATYNQFHSAPAPFGPEVMTALKGGEMTIWVYGEMEYTDVFRITRSTKFRFQIGGNLGMRGTSLAVCEEGNDET